MILRKIALHFPNPKPYFKAWSYYRLRRASFRFLNIWLVWLIREALTNKSARAKLTRKRFGSFLSVLSVLTAIQTKKLPRTEMRTRRTRSRVSSQDINISIFYQEHKQTICNQFRKSNSDLVKVIFSHFKFTQKI